MNRSNSTSQAGLRVLVLGGTTEARALAAALVAAGVAVTTSLAGRTESRGSVAGDVRIGGFGGVAGLSAYLEAETIGALVDATHPFAAEISRNAVVAAEQTGVPLVRLVRPGWAERPGWQIVATIEEAAAALPAGARVLLTIGRQEVGAFFARGDCSFVARTIDPPEAVPPHWHVLNERGPFTRGGEMALMQAHRITHLVSKNSGAGAVAAKLDAADTLGVAIVMVARPVLPPAIEVQRVSQALAWVQAQAGAPSA